MPVEYYLEVYGPDDKRYPRFVWKSQNPFPSIHEGNRFDPAIGPNHEWVVNKAVHLVYGDENAPKHKLMIWCDLAPGSTPFPGARSINEALAEARSKPTK